MGRFGCMLLYVDAFLDVGTLSNSLLGNERLRKHSMSNLRPGGTVLSGTSTQEFDDLGAGYVRVKQTGSEQPKAKSVQPINHSPEIESESPDKRPWDDQPIGKIAIDVLTGVLLALALILLNTYMP